MSIFGPPNIEKMKAKKNIDGLIKALGYKKDFRVRVAATEALGEIGDARAVEPLIATLKDINAGYDVHEAAPKSLVQIGEPAVEPLIATLSIPRSLSCYQRKDLEDWSVCKDIIGALGEIGDARAVEPLSAALREIGSRAEDIKFRGQARRIVVEALIKIGEPSIRALFSALDNEDYDVFNTAVEGLIKIGKPAVEPLIAALKDGGKVLRLRAAAILGKIGDARAVEPLVSAIKDKDKDVRNGAAFALSEIGDERAIEPLIDLLKDDDLNLPKFAAEALGEIGDARAVEPLIAALKKGEWVRQGATGAMVKIGEQAVEPLIAALSTPRSSSFEDEDWKVCKAIVGVLGEIGDARAVEPLIAALKDENSAVRAAAADALGKIDDARAVEPLIADLLDRARKGDTRLYQALPLEKLGWKPDRGEAGAWYWIAKGDWENVIKLGFPAVEPLIALIQIPFADRGAEAAEALGKIGDPRAIEPMIAMLKDPNMQKFEGVDWDARNAAAKVLVRMYRKGALDEQSKKRILAERKKIMEPHIDTGHDCGIRRDTGIGVDFPL